jgi:penicillin-binding protein 1A
MVVICSKGYLEMMFNRWWKLLLLGVGVAGLSAVALLAIAIIFIYPTLPSLDVITNYQPKQPLRIYSEEGLLIDEFGEERRAYIKIESVPKILKDAVLAIEDRRFYQHHGVDYKGVLRAIKNNITGKSHEGASTITMQVAKNFFTEPNGKRNFTTKINEALLALKIERSLPKNKILELYINQIYLGQRSYGFAAAAQTYFGKPLNSLNLAEAALLAGLPKAPSGYNPFVHPKRAKTRQHEVLRDMQRYGFIDEAAYEKAVMKPLVFKTSKKPRDLAADYVAEIVRDALYKKYQDDIYVNGLKVYTTVRKVNQEAANAAVRDGILNYEMRHGYRGPEKNLDFSGLSQEEKKLLMQSALDDLEEISGLIPAVILQANSKEVIAYTKYDEKIQIKDKGLTFIAKHLKLAEKKLAKDEKPDPIAAKLKAGAVIRLLKRPEGWLVTQVPQVEAALVSLDPKNGAIRALVGGFDFRRNKFNHATQAWRQPGSSFKPFIYSAALEKGFTPATVVEDEPINYSASQTGDKAWAPQNYDGEYNGPIRLRKALAKSVNTVAIRMLSTIGAEYAQDYITRFGFAKKDHPAYLTMALGAGSTTVWQMANAYAVFANGGYRVQPNLIAKIVDQHGKVIFSSKALEAGLDAPRVIDARNAYIMNSMMQTVVQSGTATRALKLGRADIAGKTGTTNDHRDTWFAGYSPQQVAVVWLGYDKPQPLGKNETGGLATLPIWTQYMQAALNGLAEMTLPMPDGIMTVNIDPLTGVSDETGIPELFYFENPPPSVEKPLPPLLMEEFEIPDTDPLQSQAQGLLQPEVFARPAPPTKSNAANPNQANSPTPTQPAQNTKIDPQDAAAKMLNSQH